MIIMGIILIVFGVIVGAVGLSALQSARSSAMPLLFRSLHQSTSRQMGVGLLFLAGVLVVAGVALIIVG